MLASHGLQLSASDCVCGRRSAVATFAACGGPAVHGGPRPRRSRPVESASRTVGADQPPRRKRTASRGTQETVPAQAPPAAATRSKRTTDVSAAPPRRRRQRQPKAPALTEVDAHQRVLAAPGLYQDCCGRLYSRSVYRVEVLDEVMLDGLRVAELCGPAAFATVTSTVTIADVLAAAGAAAAASDALTAAVPRDRTGRDASALLQASAVQASGEPGPVLATTAGPLDQRARRQERRAASARSSARRRQVDALSAAAGAVAMVEPAAVEAAAKRALRAELNASPSAADAAAVPAQLAGLRIPPPHALARIMSSSEGQRRRPLSSEALLSCSPLERLLHNSIPNISREEEESLVRIMKLGDALRGLASQLSADRGRPAIALEVAVAIGNGTTAEMVSAAISAGGAARRLLVRSQLRLVVQIAKSMLYSPNVELDDLVTAGLDGLEKGLDRFDPDRGVRLTSVCHWWVSTAVRRTQQRLAHVIKVPEYLAINMRHVYTAKRRLRTSLGREPTVEEIAAETALSVTAVNTAIRSQKRVDGMHSAGGSDAGREAPRDAPTRDVYAAHAAAVDTSGSALDAAEGRMLRRHLLAAVAKLPERERVLLTRYAGLDGGEPATMRELAEGMAISVSRLNQIKLQAFEQLRADVALRQLALGVA